MDELDIAIVGYGPVGATAANLLGARGWRTAVFERETAVYALPRAVHVDGEVMRVFASIGLRERIIPDTAPIDGMRFLDRRGRTLFQGYTRHQPYGFPASTMVYQPRLEDALRAGAARYPCVDVRLGHEVTAVRQDDDGVTLRVRDHDHDHDGGHTYEVRARYTLGCDGARSLARKQAGIPLRDLGFHQPWLVVDTLLKEDLSLPTVSQQVCDPARPVTFVPAAGAHRRWEFRLRAGERREELERPERVRALLATRARIDPDRVEVIRAAVYTFHALLAAHWRDGRVFLLGDAAHQMPPFLGQGLCAGIRDAHNLAWKLHLVLRGAATSALLDSYQQEREPHVRSIIRLAVWTGRVVGADEPLATLRDATFALLNRVAPVRRALRHVNPGLPPLHGGVLSKGHRHGHRSPVGAVFVQPRVRRPNGRMIPLDEELGSDFAVVGYGVDPRASVDAADLPFWDNLPARFIRVEQPSLPTHDDWPLGPTRGPTVQRALPSAGEGSTRPGAGEGNGGKGRALPGRERCERPTPPGPGTGGTPALPGPVHPDHTSQAAREEGGDTVVGSAVVIDVEGVLAAWFTRHSRSRAIVVLRPDRYVFGVYNADEIHRAADELRRRLCATPGGTDA